MKQILPALALLVAGCVQNPALRAGNTPIGQDFDVGALSRLEIGVTTIEGAEALLGQPTKQSSLKGIVSATSKEVPPGTPYTLTDIRYEYAPEGAGFPIQRRPFKRATLAFQDDVLAAYSLGDTIDPAINATIDDSLLARLHQCQTTVAEALAMLGPPSGFNLTVPRLHPGPSGLTYQSVSLVNGARVGQSLKLSFDKSGLLAGYLLADNTTISGAGKDSPPPACPG